MTEHEREELRALQARLEVAEKKLHRLKRIVVCCAVGLAVVLLALFIPAVRAVLGFGLFVGAIVLGVLLGVLLFISVVMGLLEWLSPSGRIPPGGSRDSQSPT